MNDMITWLRRQLEIDERVARKAAAFPYDHPADAPWERASIVVKRGVAFTSDAHIALHGPERVLRQVQAHRAILDDYDRAIARRREHPDDVASAADLLSMVRTVKRLSSIYSDRDGYRAEWAHE